MYFKYPGDVYTLKGNMEKLDEIAKFEKNWNGYDADPIPEDLIAETRSILNGLGDLPQPFVAPFGGGDGLQIEWEKPDGTYLEIEIRRYTSKDQPNKYETFLCQSPKEKTEPGFYFSLEGTVDKEQSSINNLVSLFYGRQIQEV